MNIYSTIKQDIINIAAKLELQVGLLVDSITSEPTKEEAHGDIATNIAMVLAKSLGKPPRAIAELIVPELKSHPMIEKAEIAGPGFINITVKKSVWFNLVKSVLELGVGYGNSNMGNGERVNIEYVSANPTGPMHVGHARGAVYGDVLANLLIKTGYNVTKEYYINDAGAQIDTLTKSAFFRYREACGEKLGEMPEGYYPGEYLKDLAEALHHEYGIDLLMFPEEEALKKIRKFTIDSMMALIKHDLYQLGIVHDIFSSEKALHDSGKIEETLKFLENKGLLYQGVLESPKGEKLDDWEPREQTLFCSTKFGDDVDRPLKKSDGSWTYFAPDIAYHKDKWDRGFQKMILIVAIDHGGYKKRMNAAVSAITGGKAKFDMILYQLVNFIEDGKQLKMSKRAGNYITVRDVVDKVGKGAVRFIMLTRKHTEVLDFDFAKVVEQSKDNPIFYVQYAYARASSVFRNAAHDMPEAYKKIESVNDEILELLGSSIEISLIKKIAEWPRIVESAAKFYEPHRVAFYLMDLASSFHVLWNRGKDESDLRFLIEDNIELTCARLALVKSMMETVASGLHVLGVEPLSEM